jgi:integral membrane sensor domain MASE1
MMNPLYPVRWRKILIGFLLALATVLGLAIIIVPSPDLSVELELRKQVRSEVELSP